jgi:hypothetical protein
MASIFVHIQHGDFFLHLFLGALIFIRNFKMLKFLHILEEQTKKKKCCQKTKFKMAAQDGYQN